jgi:hypothetical protein
LGASDRRLKGRVIAIEKTGETAEGRGDLGEVHLYTEVTRFSKRTPNEVVPDDLKDRKIKLARHCLCDWHYRSGVEKTLSAEETDHLLRESLLRRSFGS